MDKLFILSYDGDNAGKLVGRSILADNAKELSEVSARINLGHEIVQKWVQEHGGQVISGGGDEGTFQIPQQALSDVEHLRADYQFATNLTMSIGVGETLSEAGKSLLVAKFRGKNTVVQYSPEVDQEIQSAAERMESGTASFEEQKLGNAYLKPEGENMATEEQKNDIGQEDSHDDSCPYCEAMKVEQIEDPDHCKYCHDMDSQENEESCPYCAQMDSEEQHDPNAEGHPNDCPYCQEMGQENAEDAALPTDRGPSVNLPTTQSSQNYEGQNLTPPLLDKPDSPSMNPPGLGINTDSETNENIKLDQEQGGQVNETLIQGTQSGDPNSQETVQSILEDVDALPAAEQTSPKKVNSIDDTNLAVGNEMEGNVSRPENFDANTPGDMGLGSMQADATPELTAVLQEGFENESGNIQREQVIQMVAGALQEFKGCKQIIEQSRNQSPQLYSASISMLKAMIEMARMLGLDQEAEQVSGPAEDAIPGSSSPQEGAPIEDGHPDYDNLFPAHPENGGSAASEEDAASVPKSEGAIGQPIGKLPTHNTTTHVPRTPFLEGAVNAKGQKKVIDPITKKVRWIDMREGKVKSNTGVPVKPGQE